MVKYSNFVFYQNFFVYLFNKKFLVFFFFPNIRLILKFFSMCFLKISMKILSFLFVTKSIFSGFLKSILCCFNKFSHIFFFKLRLKGLGYRIRRICRNLYKFFFIFTNFFYLHLPKSVNLKIKRRRLIFFGLDLNVLRLVLVDLLLLNKLFIYCIRGFVFPRQIIFLKPGKKRL